MELRTISYEEATIEQMQLLIKKGIFNEIIFDGDNKTIGVSEEETKEAEKRITEICDDIMRIITPTIEKITEVLIDASKAVNEIGTLLYNAVKNTISGIYNGIYPIMNKKISKKKFVKLLQSQGVQRNEINKIVQGNKEKYTYLRYYNIVKNLYEKQ